MSRGLLTIGVMVVAGGVLILAAGWFVRKPEAASERGRR
jgi:hypothetical protein